MAQMLETWHVAMPSGLLPSFFQIKALETKMAFYQICSNGGHGGPKWPHPRES